MIADHDRDRQSRDFQNMIVSDRRSWFGKMIVSDRRSRKKVSCLTLEFCSKSAKILNTFVVLKFPALDFLVKTGHLSQLKYLV